MPRPPEAGSKQTRRRASGAQLLRHTIGHTEFVPLRPAWPAVLDRKPMPASWRLGGRCPPLLTPPSRACRGWSFRKTNSNPHRMVSRMHGPPGRRMPAF